MRTSSFLHAALLGLLVAGCGDSNGTVGTFTPDDVDTDADADTDASVDDVTMPSFDVPVDNAQPPPDVPSTFDVTRPPDGTSVDRPTAVDVVRPPDNPTTCPMSCTSDTQCNPCATPGDPGNYCCISGLCLYMTGACMAPAPDGGPGTPDGSDGSMGGGDADDGGDGTSTPDD